MGAVELIQYRARSGATKHTHYTSRSFENGVWHAAGIYEALQPVQTALKPDLIVGHSGFGSTLYLRELWPDVPIIDYFEYFYRARHSDLDFRPDVPISDWDRLRAMTRNAMILLDLEYCTVGYSPTQFQHSTLPDAYKSKVRVLHDGIDTEFWRRREVPGRQLGTLRLAPETRLVTYVSRGLEKMRGFDVFMRMAKQVYEAYPDVRFVIVGADRVAYGGDLEHIAEESFKEHVLKQDRYDPERLLFAGNVPPDVLAQLLSISDLHVYLTVPFVLSWSLLDAMACECVVLGSDTDPVREVISDGENGLLCDFFDVERLTGLTLDVLRHPERYRELGVAARRTVEERYSMRRLMPEMAAFYEEAITGGAAAPMAS